MTESGRSAWALGLGVALLVGWGVHAIAAAAEGREDPVPARGLFAEAPGTWTKASQIKWPEEDGDEADGTKSGHPGKRYAFNAHWDPHHRRVILFGGEDNIYKQNRLASFRFMDMAIWAFDPATGKWSVVPRAKGNKPARPRAYFASAYDPDRKGLWVHGGFDSKSRLLGDLWFVDMTRPDEVRWEKVEQKGELKPPPRDAHALVYDAAGKQLVVVGGLTDFKKMAVEPTLWRFDLASRTWSKGEQLAGGRFGFPHAWDAAGRRLFVWGGHGAGGRGIADRQLRVYDAAKNEWTARELTGQAVGNYAGGTMAYMADRDQLMVIGGGRGYKHEIVIDLKTNTAALQSPRAGEAFAARGFGGMAYAPASRLMFLYGGSRGSFYAPTVPPVLWIK